MGDLRLAPTTSGNWEVLVVEDERGYLAEPPAPRPRVGDVAWYVPYARVHERTVNGAPRDAVWVDVSRDPLAYHAALAWAWESGESFALLEHDVVCRPDVVAAFEDCPEPWCVFGYSDICHVECMEAWRNMLGCTRFRAEVLEAVPDAVSSIPEDRRDWHNVCDEVGDRLRAAGFSHHWHFPWVDHHHMGRHETPVTAAA